MGVSLPVDRLRSGLEAWGLEDADVLAIAPGETAEVFLVLAGHRRWVAKFFHDERAYAEVGLRASQVVASDARLGDFDVAVPVETRSGALTEMVEWPEGAPHPLALLTFVAGDPLATGDPEAVGVIGDVCGRVHAALLETAPDAVGITDLPGEPDHDDGRRDRDAGEFDWLLALSEAIEREAWESRHRVRHAVGVWDGPDIRRSRSGGRVGLLDFGHSGWFPVVHVVANRSLNVALEDTSRLPEFLAAVSAHLPLTADEQALLTLYRVRNAAIYASWVATEKVARRQPLFNETWFRALLAMIERELPLAVGESLPQLRRRAWSV